MRRCRCKWVREWTWRSSPFTSSESPPSSAQSISSPRSPTCAPPA
jgi:hypothetical protein